MKLTVNRAIIGVAIVGVAVCAVMIALRFAPDRRQFFTDAETIKQARADAPLRDILWQPPVKLPELINTNVNVYEPRVSWDGLTLFFVRGRPGENSDIYACRRTPEGWADPRPVAGVNSEDDDLGPEPSADGKSLYFYSNRTGGSGGYDIWVARRGQDGWQSPINLGPRVNSEFNDYGPALTRDGATLYYASNRPLPDDARKPDPDAWPATLREDLYHRTYDIYITNFSDAGPARAEPVMALNTPSNEGSPCVSPVDDFLFFASDRPGGEGGFDIYRTRRLRGDHLPPTALGPPVNTPANELDPGLTMGGYRLYFSSDRPRERLQPEKPNEYRVYVSSSREVFLDVETVAKPPINWAALWPNLLWLLLALLALLALLFWLRAARDRKLSLLARCLLVSLMIHALLMLLFAVWNVSATVSEMLRDRGEIRIALASPTTGDSIAVQIRGQLTAVEPPAALTTELERQPVRAQVQPAEAAIASVDVERERVDLDQQPVVEAAAGDAPPQRPEMNPAEAPSPRAEPSRPLEIATPTESARIDATEADEIVYEAPAPPSPADRAQSMVPTSQPIGIEREVALNPEATDASESENVDRSMADATAAADAAPDRQEPRERTPVLASLQPTLVELSTPVETGPRETLAESSMPQVAAAAPDVPRSDFAAQPPLSADARASEIAIEPSADSAADSSAPSRSLAIAASPVARDAPPQSREMPVERADSTDIPPVAVVDPAMPTQGNERAARREATELKLAAAEGPPSRRKLERDSVRDPAGRAASQAQIQPIGTNGHTADGDATLVGQPSEAIRDAGATDPLVPDTQAAAPSTVAARSTPLALPMLESAPPIRTSESDLQLASDVTVVPRASVVGTEGVRDSGIQGEAEAASSEIVALEPSTSTGPTEPPSSLTDAIESPHDARARRPHSPDTGLSPDLTRRRPDRRKLGLRLPSEIEPSKNSYAQRNAQQRRAIIDRMGGSDETERAVAAALNWLARHQSPDGRWAAHDFDAGCGGCGGQPTEVADIDVATTGLALLCFLGADHTQLKDGPYRDTVRRGVEWLLSIQRPDGDLRYGYVMSVAPDLRVRRRVDEDGDLEEREETMYSHGIASIALSEAYGMTADRKLLIPVRNAIHFIVDARNRRQGGWRYDPGQKGDTSVLGWQVMALKSAQMAGIDVPRDGFAAARDWIDMISERNPPGEYSYRPGRRATPAMTAEGMFVRQLLGVAPDLRGVAPDLRVRRTESDARTANSEPPASAGSHSAAFVSRRRPEWEDANTYYWYYATLALFQHQGETWERWNAELKPLLLENQQTGPTTAGSWAPVGEWTDIGGRVYQTALCTLMLEVYYRYLPLYAAPPTLADGAIGAIRGRVTDIESGRPIEGATIRLTLPKRPPMTAQSGADGRYVLDIPAVPKFFALSASRSGFVPATVNIPSAEVAGNLLTQNFMLWPQGRDIIALEDDPEVHHLGNNAFSGSINSQFQREAEGDRFITTFDLDANRLPAGNLAARLWMLHKGSQCPHEVYLNGQRIGDMVRSPNDGSFGEHTIRFNSSLLRAGANVLEIQAISCSGDLDDWEFVNLQIRLSR